MKARLLVDGEREPARHFSIEEAVLRALDAGSSPPTLRLRRSVPALWIGLFQKPDEDVDLERARKLGIPVMRRYNPGGAVYQDSGTLCYTCFFLKEELFGRLGVRHPDELYARFGDAAVRALGKFGARAEVSPVNDVTIGGRKVYGSAQVEHYSAFAHSGTFLVSCDLDLMAELLRPSAHKYAARGFTDVRGRVVNLSEAVGRLVTPEGLAEALIPEISEASGYSFEEGELTERERELAQTLFEEKYGRPEWTFRSGIKATRIISRKARKGVVTLAVTMEGGRISAAELWGDFLAADSGAVEDLTLSIRGLTIPEAIDHVRATVILRDLSDDIASLLEELP
jgi:lipoate-protein ligase A